ncbi:hypothetical protein FIBSPDRAFT_901955 [Athelia psychrophila]|uniref:Uncharacterized protein n=1 Tax=Athelia psychrophila TaxID=1759441 RepID=A0A165WDZ2_9AGAM|nr:hypothetical protein FIBSPDRAFT_901955 [Fibularhizoctonia sp. CBS 109695]
MPCTYISFQEQAEVAIFVDRTKSNMLFEDQLMLSPVDIEHNNIMGMCAALVETENERHIKDSSGKKQVPVYREQYGKVPASFQLVPEYVQPKTSAATLLKAKALKTLNGNKARTILDPTPFYTDAFVATALISTSSATSEWDSATSNFTPVLSADSGLSSFDSIDSIYSLYSQSDVEPSESASLLIPRSQCLQFCYDFYGNITFPGRTAIVNGGYTYSIKHRLNNSSGQEALDHTTRKSKIILGQEAAKYRSNFRKQVIELPGARGKQGVQQTRSKRMNKTQSIGKLWSVFPKGFSQVLPP